MSSKASVQGACTPLANIGLAVGVNAGATVPDVSTPEALRAALLAAGSVVHAPPTATPSGAQSDKVIKQLGIARGARRPRHAQSRPRRRPRHDRQRRVDAIGIFPKERNRRRAGNCACRARRPPSLQLNITYGAGVTAASLVPGRGGGVRPVPDRAGEPPSLDRLRLRPAGELSPSFRKSRGSLFRYRPSGYSSAQRACARLLAMVTLRPVHSFLCLVALVIAGCATDSEQVAQTAPGGPPPRPKVVLVNDFFGCPVCNSSRSRFLHPGGEQARPPDQ